MNLADQQAETSEKLQLTESWSEHGKESCGWTKGGLKVKTNMKRQQGGKIELVGTCMGVRIFSASYLY